MKRLAILGSGDLGNQIVSLAEEIKSHQIVGYYDDFQDKNTSVKGVPILGNSKDLNLDYQEGKFDELIIAIGYKHMKQRASFYETFQNKIPFASLIHPSCVVSTSAKIGRGVIVFQACSIGIQVEIGNNVLLYDGCIISHDSKIDNHTMLSPKVALSGFCKVGKSVNLGVGTTVIDNIEICDHTKSGGGTLFVKNVTNPGLYIGSPAKLLKA